MKYDSRTFMGVILFAVVILLGYVLLNTPEHRTVGEKIGDAVNELQDRTPAEKIQDKIDTK